MAATIVNIVLLGLIVYVIVGSIHLLRQINRILDKDSKTNTDDNKMEI